MTKDRRLYARFDIGMDEHAKIMLLSDAAFRALFESTLYARRQLTDGFLDERIVMRKWGAEVAAELSSNDPERPSWKRMEGGWAIHDFAEHQTTNADIELKREAGRKGGLAKAKQPASTSEAPAKHLLDECSSNSLAKTETETDTKTEEAKASSSRTKRGTRIPADFIATPEMVAWAREHAPTVDGPRETAKFVNYWQAIAGAKGVKLDWVATWRNWLLNAAERAPNAKPTTGDKMRDTLARGQALQDRLNGNDQLQIGA
jgi:hypothetical protein